MPSLKDLLPDGSAILELGPEDLAGYLLEYLNSRNPGEGAHLTIHNQFKPSDLSVYPAELREQISWAFGEAWSWLEREGLLAPVPGMIGADARRITRRGKRLRHHADVEALRKASLLPKGLLHSQIGVLVWADFLRGDYESVVFKAFRQVEIAVRSASNLTAADWGMPLMRKAFDSNSGPLTDKGSLCSRVTCCALSTA